MTNSILSSSFSSPIIKVRDRVAAIDEPDYPGTVVGFKQDWEGKPLIRVQWDSEGEPEGELYQSEVVKL